MVVDTDGTRVQIRVGWRIGCKVRDGRPSTCLVKGRHSARAVPRLAGHVERVLDDVDLVTAQVPAALHRQQADATSA